MLSNEKILMVTGVTRGIGKAIAMRLARENGVRLVLVSRNGLAQLKSEFDAQYPNALTPLYFSCDIADAKSISDLVTAIERDLGKLDVLVNNAGMTIDGAFTLLAQQDIQHVMKTNMMGAMRLTLGMLPSLLKSSCPTVINISSLAAVSGKEGQGAYSASKGAIIGFSKLLASCFGSHRLVVNSIAPGFIHTEMVDGLTPESYAHILEGTALPRMGEVAEVAELCAFLATTSCRYLNSTTLKLDGGFHR